MALRDIVATVLTTPSVSRTSSGGSATDTGAATSTYDGDTASFYGRSVALDGDGGISVTVNGTYTWVTARTIEKIVVIARGDYLHTRGNYPSYSRYVKVSLQQSGSWVEVSSTTTGGITTITLETGWTDVTGIKVDCYGYDYGYEDSPILNVYGYIYEVQAFHTIKKHYAGVV